jgi:recombination protein U
MFYKENLMATWKSRGLRGSTLEDLINRTNDIYREKGLALIQKVPTPITPIKIDKESRHITLAYFDQKSTVDYIGVVQGVPVCFDAKECSVDTFPMLNIHEHQVKFMEDFEKQNGVAFLIIYYSHKDEFYYVPFKDVKKFYDRSLQGGRKSFRFEEVDKTYQISKSGGVYVHYLEMISKDLNSRK